VLLASGAKAAVDGGGRRLADGGGSLGGGKRDRKGINDTYEAGGVRRGLRGRRARAERRFCGSAVGLRGRGPDARGSRDARGRGLDGGEKVDAGGVPE
jgi:hypothetical protein